MATESGGMCVSVVMGTFNGERHVREQLASVLAQTSLPAEIIVCDDGSSDQTLLAVEEVRRSAAVPVQVVRNQKRLGFADNFLTGAMRAESEFVAFCDQDDIWYPTKLERGVGALREHSAVLSAHQVDLVDTDGVRVGEHAQGIDRTRVVEPLTGDPWMNYFAFTLLFRRDLIDVMPYLDRGEDTYTAGAQLSHDRWVCMLAHSLGRVVLLDTPLAGYRQHGAQLYGSAGAPSSTQRPGLAAARARLTAAQDEQRLRLRTCRRRESQFRSSQPLGDYTAGRLQGAADSWSALGDRYAARVRVHSGSSIARRLGRTAAEASRGLYSHVPFTPRDAVKDVVDALVNGAARTAAQ